MSDSEEVTALKAKVKQLQETLSKVGQKTVKVSQKEKNAQASQGKGDATGGGTGGKQTSNKQGEKGEKNEGAIVVQASHGKGRDAGANANQAYQGKEISAKGKLTFFDHLPVTKNIDFVSSVDGDKSLHPSILQLGSMYRFGLIREDDDRVTALLTAFCHVINDYKTPPNKSLSWDLDKYIRVQVQFLVDSRPLCVGMGNLIKQLRHEISQSPPDSNEADAKAMIISRLYSFFEDRILYAQESIGALTAEVVHHDDVILTFGSGPLLRKVLLAAAVAEKNFRLIVVDSRPLNDGLGTLRVLSPHVPCVYTPFSGAANMMKEATRVLLGASAFFSNGSMQAPCGSAVIASLAKEQAVPVIAVCESYKFAERVQLDSIVSNELGSAREICVPVPDEVKEVLADENSDSGTGPGNAGKLPRTAPQLSCEYLGGGLKADPKLPFQVLNPRYDLTPIENISAVATETGLIPPTSVPVLIRELREEGSGGR